jgi:hypothetical protein
MRVVRRDLTTIQRGLFHDWGPHGLAALEARLERGEAISSKDLALAIEGNPDVPLPPALRDYLVRHLRGEVSTKRGPKRTPAADLKDRVAALRYERALRVFSYLDVRKKRNAEARRFTLPRGEESPSERALNHTARKLQMNPGTLRNRLSRAGFLSNSRSRQRR